MRLEGFIAGRLSFKGRIAVIAIAISFFIMIVSVAISRGFSKEVRAAVLRLSGDIMITNSVADRFSEHDPIEECDSLIAQVLQIPGVVAAEPAVYRAGIVKCEDQIYGALFKGSLKDTASMQVRIPEGLSRLTGKESGDEILAYFISEHIRARRFTIAEVYSELVETGENFIIHLPISDMRRLNGWSPQETSAVEVSLKTVPRSRFQMREKAGELSMLTGLAAVASTDNYSLLFDWLDLIDYNVYAILALMTVVAGFNMVSGLLILLFRNISTIGTLKALGMSDKAIALVFLRVGARIVATGMLIGNSAALLFCLLQGLSRFIKLNPENYFVSFVPISVDPLYIILVNLIAFIFIMVALLLPSLFISKIDPSLTVKTR